MGSQFSCHICSFEQLAAHLPLQAADLPCHWSSMKAFTLMNKRHSCFPISQDVKAGPFRPPAISVSGHPEKIELTSFQ